MAALQGKTIKQFATERLFPVAGGEEQAWRDLKLMLAQRISAGLSGGISTQSIDEIVNEELGLLVLPRHNLGADRGA